MYGQELTFAAEEHGKVILPFPIIPSIRPVMVVKRHGYVFGVSHHGDNFTLPALEIFR